MQSIQVGTVGVALRVTVTRDGVAQNIASASTKQLKLRRPDGACLVKPLAFVSDGMNGQLEYVIRANDLGLAGEWALQVYLVVGGFTGHSTIAQFRVEPNLE